MNEELRRLQGELATIEEVKVKRDIDSKELLEKALRRIGGDELANAKFLSERDKVLLAEAVLEEGGDA